ncbi:unnamed protein product, partial [Symbiodinium sp. KB8]
MAFAEGLHQLNRRPTRDHAIPGASDEMDAPMLQIRSVDGTRPPAAISAAANEASDHSAVTKTGSIKKRFGGSTTSTTLSDRLREAQLAADAASSRQGSHAASEKPLVSAMSLQTSMLKTMLKKPAVQDSKKQSSTMSLIGDYNWDKSQGGDYMSQYAAPYQQYMQGAAGSGSDGYQKYYSKYTSEYGSGGGGGYDKYMSKYAGNYASKYMPSSESDKSSGDADKAVSFAAAEAGSEKKSKDDSEKKSKDDSAGQNGFEKYMDYAKYTQGQGSQ